MQHFCFPDLGKEKLCSILVFGNVYFKRVVRINHDHVASRGAVGRTHTIVRLQTRMRRKDGTEKFGGFVYGWISTTGFCVVGFYVLDEFQCLFSCYHTKGYHAPTVSLVSGYHMRATTPHLYPTGYHA